MASYAGPGSPTFAGVAAATTTAPTSPIQVAVEDGAHVARVEVPAGLRPTEHLPGTYRLKLSGPGAVTARPETIAAALLSSGKIQSLDTWRQAKYYRLQNPFERFVSFRGCGETPALKSRDTIEAVFEPGKPEAKGQIQVTDLEDKELRFTLQFVPPGADARFIDTVLTQAGVRAKEITRSAVRQDLWFCTADCTEDEVPHFISSGNLTSKPLPADRTAIMVSVPGRPIKCYYCGDPGHWSNKCQSGRDTRRQRYVEREEQRKEALEKRRRAKAEAQELIDKVEEQRRVDAIILQQELGEQLSAEAAAADERADSPAAGSQDSVVASPAAPEDSAPQVGVQTEKQATSPKTASPAKQSATPTGKSGPPRSAQSLHFSTPNERKRRSRAAKDQMASKKQRTPAPNESISIGDADFLESVGLGDQSQRDAILVLKKSLFNPGREEPPVVEGEGDLIDLSSEDESEDVPIFKFPDNPVNRGSPELTVSGSIPSYQRPPESPALDALTSGARRLSFVASGKSESLPGSPASNASTPAVQRAVRSIERQIDGGGPGKTIKTYSKTKKKETPSSQGELSENQMN